MKVYNKVVRTKLSILMQNMTEAPILNGFISIPKTNTTHVFNAVDKDGDVWFITSTTESQPKDTKVMGRTNLLFTDAHVEETNMISLYGQAEVTTTIPTTKFKGGKQLREWLMEIGDATPIAIKLTPDEACFWNATTFSYETLFKLGNMGVITLDQENEDVAMSA